MFITKGNPQLLISDLSNLFICIHKFSVQNKNRNAVMKVKQGCESTAEIYYRKNPGRFFLVLEGQAMFPGNHPKWVPGFAAREKGCVSWAGMDPIAVSHFCCDWGHQPSPSHQIPARPPTGDPQSQYSF